MHFTVQDRQRPALSNLLMHFTVKDRQRHDEASAAARIIKQSSQLIQSFNDAMTSHATSVGGYHPDLEEGEGEEEEEEEEQEE